MTFVSKTLDPGTIEVPQQWRATSSRTGWRWPVRYTSIPAVVCAFDVFLILTTAVLAGNLYSSIQETNVDLSRYTMTAIVIAVSSFTFGLRSDVPVRPRLAPNGAGTQPRGLTTRQNSSPCLSAANAATTGAAAAAAPS